MFEQPLQGRLAIVGAHDRGVAAGVTAADPALFHHGHVADAVLARQVIGGRQAMRATADDHDVIGGPGLCRAPGPTPMAMPPSAPRSNASAE
jgi:hypothetical protein